MKGDKIFEFDMSGLFPLESKVASTETTIATELMCDMILECQEQVKICIDKMEDYKGDKDQVIAFKVKKSHNEFMIHRLKEKIKSL